MNRTRKSLKYLAAFIVFSLSVFLLSSYSEAANWKAYGSARYYDYEYDTESITWQDDDTVRVWTKDTVRDDDGVKYITGERQKLEIPVEGYDKYLYTAHYVEIQCSTKQDRLLALYDYNREGVSLYSEEYPQSSWNSIVPGSQASQLHKILCSATDLPK
jgi:hypothetical protein